MTASPMNFSTVPPWRSMTSLAISKNPDITQRTDSASRCSPSAVEPVTSANTRVTTLRAGAAADGQLRAAEPAPAKALRVFLAARRADHPRKGTPTPDSLAIVSLGYHRRREHARPRLAGPRARDARARGLPRGRGARPRRRRAGAAGLLRDRPGDRRRAACGRRARRHRERVSRARGARPRRPRAPPRRRRRNGALRGRASRRRASPSRRLQPAAAAWRNSQTMGSSRRSPRCRSAWSTPSTQHDVVLRGTCPSCR